MGTALRDAARASFVCSLTVNDHARWHTVPSQQRTRLYVGHAPGVGLRIWEHKVKNGHTPPHRAGGLLVHAFVYI